MIRDDYIMRTSLILDPKRNFSTTVTQRGPFYSTIQTFGNDRDFPEKMSPPKTLPSYGPFKRGNLPK